MIPPKLLIIGGVALLIFGSAGFVYNVTRPRPPLVALPAEALPVTEVEPKPETQAPAPSPSPNTASVSPTNTKLSRAQHSASPPPPRSLAIKLVSPSMGQTFTAPANVTLKAVVRPFGHDLQKVEFYRAPQGKSVCRSLSKGNETDGLTKIGETLSAPYEYVWGNLDEGIYNLMAVATYEEGEQQFSQPVVIVVNMADNYEGNEWKGFRPPYPPEQLPAQDASLLPSPTPTPALDSCPAITVSSTSESTPPGRLVIFHAAVTSREPTPDLTYDWKVSDGEIVGGQKTATITVDTSGVMEKSLTASVDVGRVYAICPNTAFHSVSIVQPSWMNARVKSSLQGARRSLERFVTKLKKDSAARFYINLRHAKESCISEEIVEQIRITKRYLTDLQAIDSDRIVLAESAIKGKEELRFSNVDFTVGLEPPATSRVLSGNKLPFVACKETGSISKGEIARRYVSQDKDRLQNFAVDGQQEPNSRLYITVQPTSNGCVTEEDAERVKASREYLIRLGIERTRIVLASSAGTREPEARTRIIYRVVFEGEVPPANSRISIGNELPFAVCQPTAIVEPPLNRKCPDVAEFVRYETATNQELQKVNTCPYNPSEWKNSATQFRLFNKVTGGMYSSFPSFKYWVTGGKVIGEGENAVWDLSDVKLRPGIYTAIVQADDGCDCTSVTTSQVRVTNFCTPCFELNCAFSDSPSDTQNFFANVEDFVHAGTPIYHWRTSKGRVISGQGTPMVSIDTTGLPDGTEYLVTVSIGGIQSYCDNQLSIKAVVGRECEFIRRQNTPDPSPTFDGSGAAKRRKQQSEDEVVSSETDGTKSNDGGEPGEGGPIDKPAVKEKEWIEVKWAPRVEIQRSFSIVVSYNRSTESVEVSDKAGNIVDVLNFQGAFKLLKERYGPDYEVYANVRLRTSGFECSTCNEEQYQSLDNQRAEWSWNVLPNKSGTQTFNLELWVKGVPRVEGKAPRGPEKTSWSKNDLKVEVYEPTLTRNTIFVSSLFLGIAGVGFSIKGIKIYRVGDTYNVGQAVAVGRNVTMQDTTVHQTKENTTVDQNTEEKK